MSSTTTNETLSAFIEAFRATEELPKVRDDLEAAQTLAHEIEDKLNSERYHSAQLQATLNTLRADLAQREADLAQATKSRDELKAVVDLVRGSLPPVPVAPSPASGPSDMSAGPVSAASTEQGSSAMDPIGSPNAANSPTNTSDYAQSHTAQSSADAGTFASAQGQHDTSPTSSATAPSNAPPPISADSPTAGGTTGQASEDREPLGEVSALQSTGSEQAQQVTSTGHSEPSPRPYVNRPYWEKPADWPPVN